ncbi:hypothetical protein ACOTEH_04675 [Achromobacter xylosoxidans]
MFNDSLSRRRQAAAHILAAHLDNGQAALLELFFLFGELVALHDAFWRRSAFRGLHCGDSRPGTPKDMRATKALRPRIRDIALSDPRSRDWCRRKSMHLSCHTC